MCGRCVNGHIASQCVYTLIGEVIEQYGDDRGILHYHTLWSKVDPMKKDRQQFNNQLKKYYYTNLLPENQKGTPTEWGPFYSNRIISLMKDERSTKDANPSRNPPEDSFRAEDKADLTAMFVALGKILSRFAA